MGIRLSCSVAEILGLKRVPWLSRRKTLVDFGSMTSKDDKGGKGKPTSQVT